MYSLAVTAVLSFSAGTAQAVVMFDWAAVDQDLGNTADTEVMVTDGTTGYGSVSYAYRISKHEVTNAQYAEFLNSVDSTGANSLGLYSGDMADSFGGITFNGANANGSKYEVNAGRGQNPVVYVGFYDVLRFSNWLDNGQGGGDTETGAYTLLGGTAEPTNGNSITRNAGADFFLTSEDEWYKAAYYDPATGSYFDYATSSNTVPTAQAPAGGSNSANYNNVVGNSTPVGAYTASASPFETFDQSGNVFEWNESLISGSFRGLRGGSRINGAFTLPASFRSSSLLPTNEFINVGFRVASPAVVPEPTAVAVWMGGWLLMGIGVLRVRRRRA